jgi:hypothetical protein
MKQSLQMPIIVVHHNLVWFNLTLHRPNSFQIPHLQCDAANNWQSEELSSASTSTEKLIFLLQVASLW